MIRIGIAEDQALIRESLAIVLGLEDDVVVNWTAATGTEALRKIKEDTPDVLLIDLRMPEMDGVSVMRHIRQDREQQAPVFIVLTTFNHDEWIVEAVLAGARACFLKEVPPKLLISAIRELLGGKWNPTAWHEDWRMYAPEIQFQTRVGFAGIDSGGPDSLTSRDIQILRKLCEGATNAEIASALYLTEGTVKNYVSALYAKLGVRHRAEAVKVSRERGIWS